MDALCVLGPLHAACDRAWVRVGTAAARLLEPHDADDHDARWGAYMAATAQHADACARLAALTRHLLSNVCEAHDVP